MDVHVGSSIEDCSAYTTVATVVRNGIDLQLGHGSPSETPLNSRHLSLQACLKNRVKEC